MIYYILITLFFFYHNSYYNIDILDIIEFSIYYEMNALAGSSLFVMYTDW